MLKKTLISIILIIIAAVGWVQWKVAKINGTPEEFSYETLSQPLNGTEAYLTTTDGTRLRTIVAGDTSQPTVVLAHGFGGTIGSYNLIFNQLVKDGYRVVAFEQRGHNKSSIGSYGVSSKVMANDYKTVLEFFNVKDAILVGHSMGGFLSIRFMLDYPQVVKQRLKGVIIMASFAGDVNRDNPQNKFQIPLIKNGWIDKIAKNPTLSTLFFSSLVGTPYASLIRIEEDEFKSQNFTNLIPILQAFVDENYYPRLHEISIPCTVIVGTSDQTTPSFHSDKLASSIPNAQLIRIENKGHLLNWEAPNEIIAQIKVLAKR